MIYDDLLSGNKKMAVIGLGYVGLPIALEFAKKISVIGFDIRQDRIELMKILKAVTLNSPPASTRSGRLPSILWQYPPPSTNTKTRI
jgi:UDP-N-acetyl-D-mannosaminuronate dehydrogenase